MSWKNIKSFLILLFIIINAYLIFSTRGTILKKPTITYINSNIMSQVSKVVKNNYNVDFSPEIVPNSVNNLKNIDVTNIIYTAKFSDSPYEAKINGAGFEIVLKTDTYSYNENNAKEQVRKILNNIGIKQNSFVLESYKSDEGLVCNAYQNVWNYPVFNGKIKAVCVSSKITLTGTWYITDSGNSKLPDSNAEMADITSVIIDASEQCAKSDGSKAKITSIEYGYYVTSHDESIVSKSSPAIPCYAVKTDEGLKYYYDASNGKPIKQED